MPKVFLELLQIFIKKNNLNIIHKDIDKVLRISVCFFAFSYLMFLIKNSKHITFLKPLYVCFNNKRSYINFTVRIQNKIICIVQLRQCCLCFKIITSILKYFKNVFFKTIKQLNSYITW